MIAPSIRRGADAEWTRATRQAATAALVAIGCVRAGGPALAQAPVANARIETRSAAQGLEPEIAAVAARGLAAWIGYRLPAAPGSRHQCANGTRILLEGPAEFLVLARADGGRIVRVRTATPECDVDAGGLPLVWLTGVKPADSVSWLATIVTASAATQVGMRQLARPALVALGLHAEVGAPRLVELARSTASRDIRRQAMSLLSQSSDPRAVQLFEEILAAK